MDYFLSEQMNVKFVKLLQRAKIKPIFNPYNFLFHSSSTSTGFLRKFTVHSHGKSPVSHLEKCLEDVR